jgi:hypothetical protein
MAPLLM